MSDKKNIIKLLEGIADFMDYLGENPFKINAFRNGANIIRQNENDIEKIIANKKLSSIIKSIK